MARRLKRWTSVVRRTEIVSIMMLDNQDDFTWLKHLAFSRWLLSLSLNLMVVSHDRDRSLRNFAAGGAPGIVMKMDGQTRAMR